MVSFCSNFDYLNFVFFSWLIIFNSFLPHFKFYLNLFFFLLADEVERDHKCPSLNGDAWNPIVGPRGAFFECGVDDNKEKENACMIKGGVWFSYERKELNDKNLQTPIFFETLRLFYFLPTSSFLLTHYNLLCFLITT